MLVVELIKKKRDGRELSCQEIEFIISAYTRGEVPDYQVSAFLMATFLRGMTRAETSALLHSMLYSGQVLDFSDLPARKIDKHSTGGVGDKTSLILSPVVAAGGVYVPMLSGRGLGHTGGTLDKLEAIPGFSVNLTLDKFRTVLTKVGCAMIGQTAEVAPADKKLYALRDVTGTVESPPLICASIMSKKLAEGIDGLVLDVKTGSGAFMKKEEDSEALARLMVDVGTDMGKRMVALITDMDQPLGNKVGNALEVEECIEVLRGGGPEDLRILSLELCGWMFYLGERADSPEAGKKLAWDLIATGRALEKFKEMIVAQGGEPQIVDAPWKLPRSQRVGNIFAPTEGFITSIACEQVGIASLLLGGGRAKKEDTIDPAVGITLQKKVGDFVHNNDTLCTIHYNDERNLAEARELLAAAFHIGEHLPATPRPLIHKIIRGKNV
ncbi:MAG: thymidine phosphorylase [Terriglobia bacterium]|jgi:pyrimidine-nucleoside phosphorylase|nr:thymidine phosphorylase [Terriglobia bacterium]